MDEWFRSELSRLEQEKSSSTDWSQMFLRSRENAFLFDILRVGRDFIRLREKYPELLAEAVLRTPARLDLAAVEWKSFAEENYLNKGLPIPDYPRYIQIQEALGL